MPITGRGAVIISISASTTFRAALTDSGVDPGLGKALFPRGGLDLALAYHRRGDQMMRDRLAETDLSALRYRDRIASAVRLRLEVVEEKETEKDEVLERLVQELNLSTRTANALDKAKIRKVGDLVERTEDQLLSLEGFGETALKEIKRSLKKFGVELKEE